MIVFWKIWFLIFEIQPKKIIFWWSSLGSRILCGDSNQYKFTVLTSSSFSSLLFPSERICNSCKVSMLPIVEMRLLNNDKSCSFVNRDNPSMTSILLKDKSKIEFYNINKFVLGHSNYRKYFKICLILLKFHFRHTGNTLKKKNLLLKNYRLISSECTLVIENIRRAYSFSLKLDIDKTWVEPHLHWNWMQVK